MRLIYKFQNKLVENRPKNLQNLWKYWRLSYRCIFEQIFVRSNCSSPTPFLIFFNLFFHQIRVRICPIQHILYKFMNKIRWIWAKQNETMWFALIWSSYNAFMKESEKAFDEKENQVFWVNDEVNGFIIYTCRLF